MDIVEYAGYEICVRPGYVVLGEDPMAEPVDGFSCDIRVRAEVQPAEDDDDGRVLYDFPFDHTKSLFQASTAEEAVDQAKAYIDTHAKRGA